MSKLLAAVAALGIGYALVLAIAGRRHRSYMEARRRHPTTRAIRHRNDSVPAEPGHEQPAMDSEPASIDSPLSRIVLEALQPHRASPFATLDLESLLATITRMGYEVERFRSGIVCRKQDDSLYIVAIESSQARSGLGARTLRRIAEELESSGCKAGVLLTDLPEALCESVASHGPRTGERATSTIEGSPIPLYIIARERLSALYERIGVR